MFVSYVHACGSCRRHLWSWRFQGKLASLPARATNKLVLSFGVEIDTVHDDRIHTSVTAVYHNRLSSQENNEGSVCVGTRVVWNLLKYTISQHLNAPHWAESTSFPTKVNKTTTSSWQVESVLFSFVHFDFFLQSGGFVTNCIFYMYLCLNSLTLIILQCCMYCLFAHCDSVCSSSF